MRKLLFALFSIGYSFCLHAAPQQVFELDPSRKLVKSDSSAPEYFQRYGDYLFFSDGTMTQQAPHSERKAVQGNDIWRLDTKTNRVARVATDRITSDYWNRSYYVLNDRLMYFKHFKGFTVADLNGNILGQKALLQESTMTRESQKMSQLGNYAYFPGVNNTTKKAGLWRSNGSIEGTEEVPLCEGSICYSSPQNFSQTANKLFLIAKSPDGTSALWTITEQHKAVLLKAITAKINADIAFLPYRDGVILNTEKGLWYSDGTDAGSYAINSQFSGLEAISLGDNLVLAGKDLYVIAQHGKGDAKKVEMGMLTEPRNLTALQNKIYFTATLVTDNQRLNAKLMELDGSNSPKEIFVFEFARFFDQKIVASKGNKMLLMRYQHDQPSSKVQTSELWVSDGTKAGTIKISDNTGLPYSLWTRHAWAFGKDDFYYTAYNEAAGMELWRTDGTVAGTALSKDVAFGLPNAHVGQMVTDGSTVFRLQDHKWYKTGGGVEGNMSDVQLWKTDAITLRSSFIAEWPDSELDSELPMVLASHGLYLWVRNKTQPFAYDLMFYHKQNATLHKVLDAVPKSCQSNGNYGFRAQSIGANYYFQAPAGTETAVSCQLWVSDGTTAGTIPITNFAKSMLTSGLISQTTQLNNELYFTLDLFAVTTQEQSAQVFKTDGTVAGTKIAFSLPVAADQSRVTLGRLQAGATGIFVTTETPATRLWYWDQNQLTDLAEANNPYDVVRFQDGIAYVINNIIMRSNGTPQGTVPVLKLPPPPSQIDGFSHLQVSSDFRHLLFTGKDDFGKIRLWRSDGSSAGTVAVGEAQTGYSFNFNNQIGQDLYITTYQHSSELDFVEQLSRFSLNAASAEPVFTHHVADLNNPLPVVAAQDRLFIGSKLQLPSFGGPYVTANLDDGDFDKDGVLNKDDIFPLHPDEFADFDADRIGDNADPDDDNDEAPDNVDLFPKNALEWRDQDQDKIGDNADTDDDNDGVSDWLDSYPHDASKHSNQVSSPGTGPTEPTQPSKPVTESSSGGAVSWLSICGGLLLIAQRRRRQRCRRLGYGATMKFGTAAHSGTRRTA
ncbi:thrombospondin type 3 repeat-containing protein [Rheinheimera texasensis]|uniref:thrombospondin type 3 repeat-containing protein n=1 Tax=Rheinheimera texasensis TaxID=306205 RepID=UPI0032B1FAD4